MQHREALAKATDHTLVVQEQAERLEEKNFGQILPEKDPLI